MTAPALPSQDETRRLAFIRYLYGVGLSQSQQPEPAMGAAVLTFHDAVELFLHLAAVRLNVGKSGIDFMAYFTILKEALGQELAQKEAMRRLNTARVGLKHAGTLPSKLDVESFRASVIDFFETNLPVVFGVEFASLSMIDLIADSAAHASLREALDALEAGNYPASMAAAAVAFAKLIDEYEGNTRTTFTRSPFNFGDSLFPHRVHAAFKDREQRDFAESVKNSVGELQRAVKLLALGIDYRRYTRFGMITPVVHLPLGAAAQPVVTWMRGAAASKDDCQFAIDFVIESALKLREFDYKV